MFGYRCHPLTKSVSINIPHSDPTIWCWDLFLILHINPIQAFGTISCVTDYSTNVGQRCFVQIQTCKFPGLRGQAEVG